MANKLYDTLILIRSLDKDELRVLQGAVNNRYKYLQQRAADAFNIGDRVVFVARSGTAVEGTIIRINRLTVAVRSEFIGAGARPIVWRVSPSLLRIRQAGAL